MVSRLRRSDQEDSRYTEFLDGDSTAAVVAKVFVTQGLSQLLVSAPVQLAAASPLPRTARRWLFPAGIALMLTGAVIEALADRQKTQFQRRDDDKPDVLDTGLWGWSRHPNYFGDSVVWDGAWLAAAASAPGAWTVPAPVADELPPDLRHRRETHRGEDAGTTGLPRLPAARRLLLPAAARQDALIAGLRCGG